MDGPRPDCQVHELYSGQQLKGAGLNKLPPKSTRPMNTPTKDLSECYLSIKTMIGVWVLYLCTQGNVGDA